MNNNNSNSNLISILYLYGVIMIATIPTVITIDLLNNNPIALNDDEDINCALRAQCCDLKIIGREDPCDNLLITPDDGFIQASDKLIN